ncbi:hypothetical protein A0H81_11879 [Grifola frondosa]|uniref:Pyroglutamyl-peptidase 1 n=1 Tax=Grifola frondosa TaxID=5627 RepID=A0A1C7LV40_GRIFR|nr:hypothetical protein A0H81_11879 [Grifola frondosa]
MSRITAPPHDMQPSHVEVMRGCVLALGLHSASAFPFSLNSTPSTMPVVPPQPSEPIDPNALRVLVTGFGPFSKYKENPAWLAVKPLHNTILYADPPSEPITHNDQAIVTDEMEGVPPRPQQIHITAVEIPVTYQAVLATVPGLHGRPPVLPHPNDLSLAITPPPDNGYDFMFHIGVAGRGPLRIEKLAHKNGYRMKDADGEYAPVVHLPKDGTRDSAEASEMERIERMLMGLSSTTPLLGQSGGEGGNDGVDHPPNRGLGKGYESFADELYTEIDVAKLIHHLKDSGIEQVYSSMDAGHYLCDFIFYCSLAEAKRLAARQEKFKERNQPLSTEQVTEAIKRIVSWVCGRLNS